MEKIYYNKQFLDKSDLKEVQKSLKEKLLMDAVNIVKHVIIFLLLIKLKKRLVV